MKTNLIKNTGILLGLSLGFIYYKITLGILSLILIYFLIKFIVKRKANNTDGWKTWK